MGGLSAGMRSRNARPSEAPPDRRPSALGTCQPSPPSHSTAAHLALAQQCGHVARACQRVSCQLEGSGAGHHELPLPHACREHRKGGMPAAHFEAYRSTVGASRSMECGRLQRKGSNHTAAKDAPNTCGTPKRAPLPNWQAGSVGGCTRWRSE